MSIAVNRRQSPSIAGPRGLSTLTSLTAPLTMFFRLSRWSDDRHTTGRRIG
jgi:hypothetical protein